MRSKQGLKKDREVVEDSVLIDVGRLYLSEIIRTKVISQYHNDPLADYFGIKTT